MHDVPITFQQRLHELSAVVMILDQQNSPQLTRTHEWLGHRRRQNGARRKDQTNRRSLTWRGVDFRTTTMAARDTIHLGKAQARAVHSLGRKEGLERALTHLFGHADAGITHGDADLIRVSRRPDAQRATASHGIERVLHEVEECFAQFTGDATHHRARRKRLLELDDATLRPFPPERTRHGHHLLHHDGQIHCVFARSQQRLLANEPPDPRSRRRAGFGGAGDAHRVIAHGHRILGVHLQQICRRHDWVQGVVHVVHHARSELAHRREPAIARGGLL